jgi:hypothetical protein
MKINPLYFGLSSAITSAILWILCSLIVFLMPNPMMNMSGHMVHANLNNMNWTFTFTGVLTGLIAWSLFAGIFGWILAFTYDLLAKE